MSNDLEKGITFIARVFGLWFILSMVIAMIPLMLFSLNLETGTTDTEQVQKGFELVAEWLKWFVTSQVQIPSIIGTVFINLAYEIKKSKRPR